MARLVIAESRAKKNSAEGRQSQTDMSAANPITPKPQAALKEPAQKADKKPPPAPQPVEPEPAAAETVEPESVLSVAVEGFGVAYEPEAGNLKAQFRIKNTSPEPESVAGYTVVVLKGDDLPMQEWLVMPAVAMVGDMPSGKQGKAFSIQRYRTMNFSFKTPDHFDAFHSATVYVFLKSGELLLEEEFPVTLPPPQASASRAPEPKTPKSEKLPEQKPPEETPSEEKPSDETPSANTPPNENSTIPVFF